jgi:hypothetical protein
LRNVSIQNVVASGVSRMPCSITGLPGNLVENVRLSNISITTEGGGKPEDCEIAVPEQESKYPESTMFGPLPAYGFYCRHVRGLSLDRVRLATAENDARYAIVLDDVADVVLSGLEMPGPSAARAAVLMRNVRGGWIASCRQRDPIAAFLRVEGKESQRIRFGPGDLASAARLVESAADVPAGAWTASQEPAR